MYNMHRVQPAENTVKHYDVWHKPVKTSPISW